MEEDFIPQKESSCNKLLPYRDRLDDFANSMLSEIKYNLGRAVLFKELTPGVIFWCNRFTVYLRIYGQRFSKEDHILFIKLLYEIATTPDLEPQFVRGLSHTLVWLLKKRELISREDLVLPWKPVYKLLDSVKFSKEKSLGLKRFPYKFAESVQQLVRFCRVYFSVDATLEMLEEWRPFLCPFDAIMLQGIYYLSHFLPTCLLEKEHNSGFKLWFDELMDFWLNCTQHAPDSQEDLMKLFARLAEENVGYIDWTPYIPKIFNRFLSGLQLPIGKSKSSCNYELLAVGTAARWMIFMINSENKGIDYLRTLFRALESFYHPSNSGSHSHRLMRFLRQLTENLTKRLHRERYRKQLWLSKIPESAKLSDAEVEELVEIIKPVAMLSIFCKSGVSEAASVVQNLALIRPDMILPVLVNRTFSALESILEPHQVVSTLSCITSVARCLLSSKEVGQLHVLALLRLALPGIDPNDFRKSMVTFSFISSVISVVPLVDCSEALSMDIEMTEHERELCAISANFQDFVLEFLDRCFGLIDSSAIEQITQQDNILVEDMNMQEGILGMGLSTTLHTIFIQSSLEIFMPALQRLFNYCQFRVLEVAVAGKMVSDMVRAAVKAYPAATLKKFVPHCSMMIRNMASADGISDEENVDAELLWHLEILSEVARCSGDEMLPYIDQLEEVISLTIGLKCKKAYSRSAKILKGALTFLTQIYPNEWRSIPETLDLPLTEHLYVRDWGRLSTVKSLDMHWHVPSQEELKVANALLKKFLTPVLAKLNACVHGESLTRDEVHRLLYVVIFCIAGGSALLKTWQDEPGIMLGPESMVARERRFHPTTVHEIDGVYSDITRKDIALQMHSFLQHMLSEKEDDTKSFNLIAKIYHYLILYHGVSKDEFDMRWTSTHAIKKNLGDKLHKNKLHARAILVESAQLQHDMRLLERQSSPLTEMDKFLIDDLVQLSTSVYTEVRIKAQRLMFSCFEIFDYSARSILPTVLEKLKDDPAISHEEFKGALHILLNSKMLYLTSHYWEVMVNAWPRIIEADHSEKPSMVRIIDKLVVNLHDKFDSVALRRQVSQSSKIAATRLLKSGSPRAALRGDISAVGQQSDAAVPPDDLIKRAEVVAAEANETNVRLYLTLVEQLASKIQANNLRWRHTQICVTLLSVMIRYDERLPAIAVRAFVQLLAHDVLAMRKKSIKAVAAILQQQKKPHDKVPVDLETKGFDSNQDSLFSVRPGNRPDNDWLSYRSKDSPKTEEDWNKMQLVDKTYLGYYTWSKIVYTYDASNAGNNSLNQHDFGELCEEEKVICDAFLNESFVTKVVSFLSLEEKKGRDSFSSSRFSMFNGLSRNVGSDLLPVIQPILEKLLNENQESAHRCASEIIAGLIRGSKHWPFSKLQEMWSFLIPLLKKAFAAIIPEVLHDWTTALATATENRDPHRYTELYEFLLDNPICGDGGAFGDAGRLLLVQSTIVQQEWRASELNHRLFNYLIPQLAHPYKDVRSRVASVFTYILMFDVSFGRSTPTTFPKISMLTEKVIQDLEILSGTESQTTSNAVQDVEMKSDTQMSPTSLHVGNDEDVEMKEVKDNDEDDDEIRKRALRVAKSVLTFLSSQRYTMQPISAETFKLLPYLMPLESREDDPELQESCRIVFRRLPALQLTDELIPIAISTLIKASSHRFWNVRKLVQQYLQVMIFHNLFTLKETTFSKDICQLVLNALEDEQLEVKLEASKTLSGIVHYGYVKVDKDLQNRFSDMAKTKLPKKRQFAAANDNTVANGLRKRHAGILGMSACIQAFPYDVPEWMPQVLLEVGDHLHDAAFIQATVKKTLSEFRRTHHDNWQEHKQKFKDDQLAVLTDLLVSPNYYA